MDHIDAVKNSIQEGLGVSFVSKRAIEREVQSGVFAAISLADVDLRRPICIITGPNKGTSKTGFTLAEHIMSSISLHSVDLRAQ
jgi:DNA-binding transcriptional LysR family regulator